MVPTGRSWFAVTIALWLAVSATGAPPTAHGAIAPLAMRGATDAPARIPTPLDPFAATGGESTLFVLPDDPYDFPNEGFETSVGPVGWNPPPAGSSFQVGAEEAIGAYEAVIGLFENATLPPTGFFEVFRSSDDALVHLGYGPPDDVGDGGPYELSLTYEGPGTNWTADVDGEPFSSSGTGGIFDFGSLQATDPSGFGFSEVAFSNDGIEGVVPNGLFVPTTVGVDVNGTWHLPANATTEQSGTPSSRWGVEGRTQEPDLAPGSVETGTNVTPQANGTALWSSGAVPIEITITGPTSTVAATVPVPIEVRASSLYGAAIPGVALLLSDSLERTAAGFSTGANGSVSLDWGTPNVSAPATDVLTAESAVLGYPGVASVDIALVPELHVELVADPSTPTVAEGADLTLTFRATAPSGTPLNGTVVELASAFGGSLAVDYGVSDAAGELSVVFLAGSSPGPVAVTAVVEEAGAWGRSVVVVEVRAPPTSPLVEAEPYALVGLAALLGFVVWSTFVRRRPPLPPIAGVPADRTDGEPGAAVGSGPGSTRTPPSGGIP